MNQGSIHVDFLRRVIAAGGTIATARFSLQRGPLKFVEPMFYLELDQRGVRSLHELPWSSELETYLLFDRPCQMATRDEEAERFAAILLNNLATAADAHGMDYAQSVFVELLGERDDGVADLLTRATPHAPHRGAAYQMCRHFLEHSLDGLRNSATLNLGYDPAQAAALMTSALRIVLDETFRISARDLLFPSRTSTAR